MSARVQTISFTDPFCSWCWAAEPVMFRLRETYRDQISVRHVMGGLTRDMMDYADGSHPWKRTTADIAPHWRMVSERTGQPIDDRLMTEITDPHFSTWPACIAVTAARLQDSADSEAYLRRLRRAIFTERLNVSEANVYTALAGEVGGIDIDRFMTDIDSGAAAQAFQEDLLECARYGVTGFPTLLFVADERGIVVNGYRTFETIQMAIEQLVGALEGHPPREIQILLQEYGPMTTRELSVAQQVSDAHAAQKLESLSQRGEIEKQPVGKGAIWSHNPGKLS